MTQQDKPMRAWLVRLGSAWEPRLYDDDPGIGAGPNVRRAPWLDQPSATPHCFNCPATGVFDDTYGMCPQCAITEGVFSANDEPERSPEAAGVYPTDAEVVALSSDAAVKHVWARTLINRGVDWERKRAAARIADLKEKLNEADRLAEQMTAERNAVQEELDAAARSPDCTCNIHPCQPHERWCPKSEHYGEAKEAEGYHRGYADALASVAQEMGIDGRDRAGLTAWIAAARSPGGTLTADTANWLSWAIDLIDMYDERLASIDGADLVYSPVHLDAKAKARATLDRIRAETQPPTGLTAEDAQVVCHVLIFAANRGYQCGFDPGHLLGIADRIRAGAQPPMGLTREDAWFDWAVAQADALGLSRGPVPDAVDAEGWDEDALRSALAARLRAAAQPPTTTPVLTAEECYMADRALDYAAQHADEAGEPDNAKQLRRIATRLAAGAQPPMGLTREDVERICGYLANFNEPATRDLAARLRSLPTSTDRVTGVDRDGDAVTEVDMRRDGDRLIVEESRTLRVLATHHGVEVVGPEGTPTTEPMSWPDDDVAPDIGRLVEDWARNFGLRVTRIHVTPTTEGDDQ